MRKWPARMVAGVVALGLLAPSAEAAMVTAIQGDVLVNRGVGFAPVKEPVELAPGDLVLAAVGGSARVQFGKGCEITVRPGQIVRVSATPPCEKAAGAELPSGNTSGSGIGTSALVIGGLAVAGGVGLALGLSGGGGGGGGENRPVSP